MIVSSERYINSKFGAMYSSRNGRTGADCFDDNITETVLLVYVIIDCITVAGLMWW